MIKNEVVEMVMKDSRLSQGAKNLYLALLTLEDNGAESVTFKDGSVVMLGETADKLAKLGMN